MLRVWLFCGLLVVWPTLVLAQTNDALTWLKRIGEAQKSLNYHGTFVYAHGEQLEGMRVIHAAGEEGERERLIHLNGAAREVIRNNDLVTCIFPEEQSVLVAHRNHLSTSPLVQAESLSIFEEYYNLSLNGQQRIAGIDTQVIDLQPKDIYRYGYRFWVSPEGLLLRSDLINGEGEVVERIMFTNIQVVDKIPHELLSPSLDLKGYQWFRQEPPVAMDENIPGDWSVQHLPSGFVLKSRRLRPPEEVGGKPVEHLLVSDGLASISVFIESIVQKKDFRIGDFRMGGLNGFGRVINGSQVIVVGDVPQATVKLIAESVVGND